MIFSGQDAVRKGGTEFLFYHTGISEATAFAMDTGEVYLSGGLFETSR